MWISFSFQIGSSVWEWYSLVCLLFKLYILGFYREWLAFCAQIMLIYNEYWPCFYVDLCPVSYFFLILTDGFVELQARFLSIFPFSPLFSASVLFYFFSFLPFPFFSVPSLSPCIPPSLPFFLPLSSLLPFLPLSLPSFLLSFYFTFSLVR